MLKMLVEAAPRYPDVIARSSLKMFASSAAALSIEMVTNLERVFHTGVTSTYGMTEIATVSWVFTGDRKRLERVRREAVSGNRHHG